MNLDQAMEYIMKFFEYIKKFLAAIFGDETMFG